ncbi:uncharacterized protein BN505_00730 [Alistipes sp. CAG:157]|nr:uncharacterized protein BN505_00730 [Alistipes sp. CAG:157]
MGKTTFITLLAGLFLLHAPTTQAQGTPEKYRGANFTIETGGFVGADKFRVRGFHPLSFTGGYTFDRHWFLGIGIQASVYFMSSTSTDDKDVNLPLFVRTRYAFLTSRITPYFQLDLGILIPLGHPTICSFYPYTGSVPITSGYPTWLYCRPEAGVSFRLRKRRALHLGLGVMINQGYFNREYSIDGRPVHESSELTASLSFTAGFTF